MKKVLIIGGCGFVGSNLCVFLKKKFFNVTSFDNLSRKGSIFNYKRLKQHKIKNYNLDITKYKDLSKLPKFELIVDCCAEASVEFSKKNIDKVLKTNLLGTYNILRKCDKDFSSLIFLSSSRVYSMDALKKKIKKKNLERPFKIQNEFDINFDTEGPKTFYGFSKLASEHLIKEYSYLNKMKYIINRCGVIAGPWQYGKIDQGFVSLWVWRNLNKIPVKYLGYGGKGEQVRDILNISDLCNLIYLQIKKLNLVNNVTYSVGGGKKNATSLKNLTKICEKISNNKMIIDNKILMTSDYDIPYFVSSITNVKKIYKWIPKKNIINTVHEIYRWQKKNINNLKFLKN